MGSVEPKPEDVQALLALPEDDGPIVMINLLRYRDEAQYEAGFEAEPCSGRDAYGRYGAVAVERIGLVGGRLVWMGNVLSTVIAPDGEQWDDAVLVEYPSRKAFVEMVTQPEYLAAAPHRTAALADSRLVATKPIASLFGAP